MTISTTKTDAAWRSDAQRDFLAYHLLALARASLADYFAEDAEDNEYTAWRRRQKRRRQAGSESIMLTERQDEPEHGTLRLTGLAAANTFAVSLNHAEFAAAVTVSYDVDLETLDSGRIDSFRGDVAKAIRIARHWMDELGDLDLDLDDVEIERMLVEAAGEEADESEDTGGAPPQDTAEDRRQVRRMARSLRRQSDEAMPDLSPDDRDWMEETPQSLWPILAGAVAAASAKPRDDALMQAWLLLLNEQLELIRYRAERGRDWANEMLDEYQDRLIQLAGANTLDNEDLLHLVTALGHAKVAVKPELSEVLMGSGPGLPGSVRPEQALDQLVRPLIAKMARNVASPFEVVEAMNETAGVMPTEIRSFMAHELALSPQPVMRDAVPLMLLDADAEVRRAAALALDQTAAPDTLSPVSLRRAIALRNWIPEADRPPLDQAIRKARTKGVQPAQWGHTQEHVLRASPIDGSGAQSLLFLGKSGRTGLFAGLLLKQGFGVRDGWCSPDTPRREISSAVAGLQRQVPSPEIERSYIDVAVQNAIAAGVAEGHPPDPALLQIAEAVDGADWKDRRLDVAAESERLVAELPAEQLTEAAITASLKRTGSWLTANHLTDSWFEDDAEVNDLLGTLRAMDVAAASRTLLDGLLAQRRSIWAERFLLASLWARAVKAGQPPPLGAGVRAITWRDLALLAREVLSTRPLREIGVMTEIAKRTVSASRSGRW
ncbi:MAG TPA: hypothetical protein VMB34_31760 [Acetobacteraceae bacterium]|nr:hypothetical protein [Acetobacteraceae bacterium]